ncbi:hypothetical protein O181_118695 [Austropuccinia psidii MF-1]|uniref:C2H2-type domain-containing protein n=1 Tax=Austropuccinia psidii MF-1 TaxID=1389203 RepID=A0A9Q3KGW3_9BASI|nr:hypothetical protein [Austropuccinia psidii MF-1]
MPYLNYSNPEDHRHTQSQPHNPSHHEHQTSNHGRAQTTDEIRTAYYAPPPPTHYSTVGNTMLPSHYPHLPSSLPPQTGPRRSNSSSTAGSTYTPYHNLSVQVPLGSTYLHHHQQHPDTAVIPSWTPSVDSVRDSVSPYSRPSRSSSGALTGHHPSSSPAFAQTLRNSSLLHPHHQTNSNQTHHPPGTMQYNAQGRPLAYMCNTCFRAFDRPSALQIHERSHTGERPFPCPWNGCVKRFTTHGNMVKHSRVCPFREPED